MHWKATGNHSGKAKIKQNTTCFSNIFPPRVIFYCLESVQTSLAAYSSPKSVSLLSETLIFRSDLFQIHLTFSEFCPQAISFRCYRL